MTELLLASAAPVFKLSGSVKRELARDVLRLEVEEATDGLKTLALRLLAHGPRTGEEEEGLLYLDDQDIDFGKEIEVELGPSGEESTVFKGVISAIEVEHREGEEPQVVLYAEDKLMDLRMTRRMRAYEEVGDADIAQRIASEHGIGADATASSPTYDVVQQWNMSDLAFLRERAALIQAEVWIENDRLCFKSRSERAGSDITLVQGNHLLSVQIRADLAHQRTKVVVSGYDAEARDTINEEATSSAVQAEVSSGQTGVAVLERAFGERVSYRVREVPLTAAEARDWAKAEMLRRARSFVTVSAVTSGTAKMVVGSRVKLERVGPPFEGNGYYVTRVRHTYDLTSGFRTHFDAERATVSAA